MGDQPSVVIGHEDFREAQLARSMDPSLRDLVDRLSPDTSAGLSFDAGGTGLFETNGIPLVAIRIRDQSGRVAGTAIITKPAAGMGTIGNMVSGDLRHLERAQSVARAGRRLAAILFADLGGSTLYVGNISTSARSEVTALGDEVNEAARIEACATGGRALASKSLIERLNVDDAAALGLDPDRVNYTALAELATATDKARRNAPAIAVVDVAA